MKASLNSLLSDRWLDRERLLFAIACLVLFTLGALYVQTLPRNHDVTWLLYVAGQILAGAEPYVDVVEVNPPLILYFMIAVKAAAQLTGIQDVLVFKVVVLGLVAASLLLAYAVLRRTIPESHRLARRVTCLLAIAMLTMWVGYQFGQREHLAIALVLPYLFAAAGRAEGKELPLGLVVSIGVLAGVGVAVKPFFLPVWLGVEGYLAVTRSPSLLRRPEGVAIGATLAAYALSVVLFMPAYLELAGLAARPYRSYYSNEMSEIATSPQVLYAALVLLAAAKVPASAQLRRLRGVLTVAMLMFGIGVVVQGKGWDYHWIPVQALLALMLGAIGVDGIGKLTGRFSYRHLSRALLGLVAALTLGYAVVRHATAERIWVRLGETPIFLYQMMDAVEEHAPGGTISTLAVTMQVGWPLVSYTDVGWGSRFNCLWLLPGIYEGVTPGSEPFPYGRLEEAGELERYLIDSVVADLLKYEPDLLFVDIFAPNWEMRGFNYVDFFSRDQRFREIFAQYRLVSSVGFLAIYKRIPAPVVSGATDGGR